MHLAQTGRRRHLLLFAYVIMPEHALELLWLRDPVYEVRLIRTALKVPVARKAVRYLRGHAPRFLERLADIQPDGKVHYRFWQRGGGYDRNVNELSTLLAMMEYIHNSPMRRGLVKVATDWIWSSARYYAGIRPVPIEMDPLPWLV